MASTPVTTAAASETPRLSLPRPEPPRFHSGKTFFWGIVLILAVGFLAWLLIGHFGESNFEDYDQTRVKGRLEILAKRNAEDDHWLHDAPSYVDKAKGQQIRVPIDEAMKLTLPALQANKPHPAYPLTQSPPQPAAAPTSPDKGAGSPKDGNVNPSASNPTLPQSSPGATPAAAQSPTPVPPGTSATPPPAGAPTPGATPQVGTAATSTPTPPPAAANNALNPGNAASGAQPQPPPPAPGNTETAGSSPTPPAAPAQPLTTPTPPPTPPPASSETTPSPNPKEPGATPGGTP